MVKREAATAETVDKSLLSSLGPLQYYGTNKIGQEELKPPIGLPSKRVIPVRSILVMVVVLMAGVAAGSFMVRPEVPTAVPQNQIQPQNNIVSVSPTFTVVTTFTSASSTSSAIIYSSAITYAPPVTTLTPASSTTYASSSRSGCDPSYPTVCIPPPPPDLDCKDIPYRNFVVLPPDPHHFDGDHDGIGCET